MTTHAIVTLNISNPDTFADYRARAGDAMQKHGITALQLSKEPTRLEGTQEAPQMIVLLTADSRDAFEAWHNDPEFAAVHELRRASGEVTIFLM